MTLRLRVVRRWKGKRGKNEETKQRKMKSDIKVEGNGRWKDKGMRKVEESAIIKKKK